MASPLIVIAEGLGVYVPITLYTQSSVTLNSNASIISDRDVKADYDTSLGFGLMYDTNVGENKLFNYRLGLEYIKVGIDSIQGNTSSTSNSRFDIVNTLGFGVVRTENIRFWIGPRINIAYNGSIGGAGTSSSAWEVGLAPAVGINVELTHEMVFGLDFDYRTALVSGTYDDTDAGGSLYGDIEGVTTRMYLIYMFGETFPKPMLRE